MEQYLSLLIKWKYLGSDDVEHIVPETDCSNWIGMKLHTIYCWPIGITGRKV